MVASGSDKVSMDKSHAVNTSTQLSQDAAIVFALARTAMPFAGSFREEAERWLRLLRMHGEVGAALQAMGVGEAPLEPASTGATVAVSRSGGRDVQGTLDLVCVRCHEFAHASGADTVGTVHILFAVLSVYGSAFDSELYRRGASRDELFARLARDEALRATG